MTEMTEVKATFYDLEHTFDEEEQKELDELEEMLEMWIEKLNRPGRLLERGGKEVTKEEVLKMMADDREEALAEIMAMSAKEFQMRLFDGTLPDFVRESRFAVDIRMHRDTCHHRSSLTERQLEKGVMNYGYYHRDKLRFMTVEEYIEDAYELDRIDR